MPSYPKWSQARDAAREAFDLLKRNRWTHRVNNIPVVSLGFGKGLAWEVQVYWDSDPQDPGYAYALSHSESGTCIDAGPLESLIPEVKPLVA